MNAKVRLWSLSLCVALLAACGTPESQCREGVAKMKQRMEGVIGSGEHKDASDPVVQAHTNLGIAETQMVTGNYAGCNDSLTEAGALLNRSQRTNQQ